jgi:hypothetical protein
MRPLMLTVMFQGVSATIQDKNISKGLQNLRRKRRATRHLFLGWFLLIPIFVILFKTEIFSPYFFLYVSVPYLLIFVITAYSSQESECPKCGDKFNKNRTPWNKNCQNCGLNINADRHHRNIKSAKT